MSADGPQPDVGTPTAPRGRPFRVNAGHCVFVLGHGYHSGLAVHAPEVAQLAPGAWPALDDFAGADHYELGWGDREYYPAEHPGPWLAFRALFHSYAQCTARRCHCRCVGGLFPDSEIVELQTSRAGFARMVEFVRLTHEFDGPPAHCCARCGAAVDRERVFAYN